MESSDRPRETSELGILVLLEDVGTPNSRKAPLAIAGLQILVVRVAGLVAAVAVVEVVVAEAVAVASEAPDASSENAAIADLQVDLKTGDHGPSGASQPVDY